MNRNEIMNIRMEMEPEFYMQTIHPDRITYSCWIDDKLYDVYPNNKCPECNDGYMLYPHNDNSTCFCNECGYGYTSKSIYPVHESFKCELIFDKGECAPDTFERFMEDVEKLYHYYYDEEFSLLLERDMAAEESTLGLVD